MTTNLHVVTDDEADLLRRRMEALDRFLRQYRKPESKRTAEGSLRRIVRMYAGTERTIHTFEWELIVNEDLASEIWNPIAEKYSKRTALKDAAFLRGLLRSCVKSGLLTYDEYVDARGFITRGLDEPPPVGQYLSPEDIHSILMAIQSEPNETFRIRDTALLLCMASTGARRSEVVNMEMANVHLDEQRILLSRTKTGKTRDSWLHQAAVTALRTWIEHADLTTFLFPPLSRTGRILPGRMGSHQIWKIVRRRAEQAGISGVTPHDLRRFVVSTLLDTTNDLALASRMVGHANPNMTAKYDRRPASKKRAAVDTLPLMTVPAKGNRPLVGPPTAPTAVTASASKGIITVT